MSGSDWWLERAGLDGTVAIVTGGAGGTVGSVGYAAEKAGLWGGLTRSLALEGADLGVHVNAIAPIAYTPMSQRSRVAPATWRSGEGDAWARRLDVARVSPVVAWLIHEQCELNGEVWTVAGGHVGRFVLGVTDGFDRDDLTTEDLRDHEAEVMTGAQLHEYRSGGEDGRELHRRLMRQRADLTEVSSKVSRLSEGET